MRTMSRRPFKSLKPPPPACFPCWAAASIALCSCWQCQVWGLACSTTLQSFYVGTMSYLGGDPIQPLFLWVKKSETIGSTLRFKEYLIWYYKGITDPEPTEGTDGQVDCRSWWHQWKNLSSQPTPRWMRVTARAGATSASSSFNRKNQCTQLVLIGSVALFLLNRKSSGRLEQHKEEPCGSDNLVLPPPPLFAPTLPPSVCSLPSPLFTFASPPFFELNVYDFEFSLSVFWAQSWERHIYNNISTCNDILSPWF